MLYKVQAVVCSENCTKHTTQCEHHVYFLMLNLVVLTVYHWDLKGYLQQMSNHVLQNPYRLLEEASLSVCLSVCVCVCVCTWQ